MKYALLYISVFLISISDCIAQGCPACSNPALQSSEKLELGLGELQKGNLRFTLNIVNGNDYQGGHEHNKGLNKEGNSITTPLHEHHVNLDFIRTEISLEYTFANNWTTWLRIPYDIKMQKASIHFIESATDEEKEAIFRNRDIHHRTENYKGLSDFRLLIAHRITSILTEKDKIDLAFGTSLPIGTTEENPLTAGENEEKHLHIQFGTGTFNPLLELHYAVSILPKLSLALFSINKLSFYTNKLNYQGSSETTSGISAGYRMNSWVSPRITFANFSQTQAKWNGANDPNSGLISYNITANLSFRLNNGISITPGCRYPLYQQTMDGNGDAFEYGSTYTLNISHLINN